MLLGTTPILFHRWSDDAVAARAATVKGSRERKTDDPEVSVWRNDVGDICIPGTYLIGAISGPSGAAKFRQDPRSPRKSALDLYKAGVQTLTLLASLGQKQWDFLDRRRVLVQRNAVTRVRPGFMEGWTATFLLQVALSEYITPQDLHAVIADAGRFVGLGDYRPTFGRFAVKAFEVLST